MSVAVGITGWVLIGVGVLVTVGFNVLDGGIEVKVLVGTTVGDAGSQASGCPVFTSCCNPFTNIIVVLAPSIVTVLKDTSLLAVDAP